MATRSYIAVKHTNGVIKLVYCHWDGYPDGVGAKLLQYYATPTLAEELISHGDISSLGIRINPLGDGHTFDSPEAETTVFYGRDRGEDNVDAIEMKSVDEMHDYYHNGGVDYMYYFDGTNWITYS